MHPVGFEPTPPKRTELESVALDHSATDASNLHFSGAIVCVCVCVCVCVSVSQQRDSNSRPSVYETDALTTMLCWRQLIIQYLSRVQILVGYHVYVCTRESKYSI